MPRLTPENPSLADVARRAGVSTATVSRVLNGTGAVRPATQAKVMGAVAKLRYTPNLHARNLAGGDSRTIGMLVSNLENPFFLDVYGSLERTAQARGYEVVVANTGYDVGRMLNGIRAMLGRRVSAIAALVSEMPQSPLAELTESGVPVLLSDVDLPNKNVISFRVDYGEGMRAMITMLYRLGHRDFAFVGHHPTLTSLSARHEAFTEVLSGYGRRVTHQVMMGNDSLDGGRQAAHALLERNGTAARRPTAIVCVNDLMASGVLRGLRDVGVKVPDDVSVTGFDNVTLSEYVWPALTTVNIPRAQIGQLAVEKLLDLASPRRGSARPGDIVIKPEMVIRESTGRARR